MNIYSKKKVYFFNYFKKIYFFLKNKRPKIKLLNKELDLNIIWIGCEISKLYAILFKIDEVAKINVIQI